MKQNNFKMELSFYDDLYRSTISPHVMRWSKNLCSNIDSMNIENSKVLQNTDKSSSQSDESIYYKKSES